MEFDRSPEMFVGVLVTNMLNDFKLFPKLEKQTGKSYRELIKTREGLDELKKFIITELDKQTDLRAAAIKVEYDAQLADLEEATPTEGLTSLAKQAAPETGDLLDLDIDLGNFAEDIGKPDDTGLKSIRTSLKELKKTCD
jgi:hypothetical protein